MKYLTALKATKAIDKYLSCFDFNSKVSLVMEDGSKFKLQNAFYHKVDNWYLVFTEHYGQFIYSVDEVESIRQMKL